MTLSINNDSITKDKEIKMIYGVIARDTVPLIMTFDDDYVEFICESLANIFMLGGTTMFEYRDEGFESWE